jgi:HlyD family secretion protein
MKLWRVLLFGILLLAVGFAGALLYKWTFYRPSRNPQPSRVYIAQHKRIERTILISGTIQPESMVEIKPQVSGIVKKVHSRAGDRIHRGDVLLELDPDTLDAQLKEAESALREQELALEIAKNDSSLPLLDIKEALYKRKKQLFEQGLIDRESVELAMFEYQEAQRSLKRAEKNIELMEARVATARASIEKCKADARQTTILSPMDGMILKHNVEVGSSVSSVSTSAQGGTSIFLVASYSQFLFVGQLSALDIGDARVGMAARIRVETLPSQPVCGVVAWISPLGENDKDKKIITYEIRVSLGQDVPSLKANSPAVGELIVASMENALTIPESAVRYDAGRALVNLQKGPLEIETRQITVGLRTGTEIQVLNGLKAGDQVLCP